MSKIYTSADQLIGHTPLLEFTHIENAENLEAKILAKLEYFNPAGSVKDRIAKKMIDDICFVPEVGKLYYGRVVRLMQFGAFVEIAPGKDGLVHISKLDRKRVEKVEDVVTVGDMIWVKFMEIDEKGRWNLSRKDALIEIEAQQAAAKAAEQQ